MPRTPRRPRAVIASLSVITVLGVGVTLGLSGCASFGAMFLDGGRVDTIGAVDFETPLAIPPLAESTVDEAGRRVFDLTAAASTTEFLPGKSTPTWGYRSAGYDQSYLGPTLVAKAGEDVVVNVQNDLDEATTVHWHGMHLPAEMDGGPHQMVAPGGSWSPEWTIDQPAATLWYHPHPHGETENHVAKGLAGLFLIQDDEEAALSLPRSYGVDDVPLIVQDTRFSDTGAFDRGTRGFVGSLGDTLLVNGTVGPYLDVTTDAVRLRLLNASTARSYDFALSDSRAFQLIATDGGLLTAPHATDHIQLSPGERAEIVVGFTAGETVTLRSTPPDLGMEGTNADRNGGADGFDVLELRAAATLAASSAVPSALAAIEPLSESAATAERDMQLSGFTINQQPMDPNRIDEVVEAGATEIWSVRNEMDLPHNFHVHDVQFQVLDIGGEAPPPELAGWKDTIYLRPQTDYRIIMRFDDTGSLNDLDESMPYMYHCHLLWHEDEGMMGQFVVVEPGENAGTPPRIEHESATTEEGTSHEHR